ncbi:MAG TPA: LysE family translocator, partial [Agromyces sp.]|nr:LysE family translocator [Agromyces sp.]
MVPLENLAAFLVASVVLILIPGPSVLFVIGRTLALGRLGGLISVLGNALGMVPLVAAVALGVGALVAQSVVVFTVIKFAGALYLVYLGIQAIRHRADATAGVNGAAAPRSHWRQLGEGFVVGVTNPKTIAFFVAVLPQFVDFTVGSIP